MFYPGYNGDTEDDNHKISGDVSWAYMYNIPKYFILEVSVEMGW